MTTEVVHGNASNEATNTLDTECQLNEIFQEVGRSYGFETVNAEFVGFKDMKIRWQRSYKWADFKVSDYLNNAPKDVIEDLARVLFSRISGSDEVAYSDSLCDWLTAPKFSEEKQGIFLRRTRNISYDGGSYKQLEDSYQRLEQMGLITEDIPNVKIFWTKDVDKKKTGYCSVLMKVIAISRMFDNEDLPDYVLDYILYCEVCHLIAGFNPGEEIKGRVYEDLVAKFEKKEEAEDALRRFCNRL